jgi:hypothetical protein
VLNFIACTFELNRGSGEYVCLANEKKGAYEGFVVVKYNFSSAYFVHSWPPLLKMLSYEAQRVLATLKNAQNFNKISV